MLYIFQENYSLSLDFKMYHYKLEHDSFIVFKSPILFSPFSLHSGDSLWVPGVAPRGLLSEIW